MGNTNMEDHRQLHLPCQIQLINEPEMLLQPMLFFPLVVIVQTDFANGNHARCIRICSQLMPVRPLLKNGSGGVDTDCRKDPSRILCRKLQHFLAGLQTHSWLNEIADISRLHLLHQLRQFTLFEGISVLVI